jgi:hypothetical protein
MRAQVRWQLAVGLGAAMAAVGCHGDKKSPPASTVAAAPAPPPPPVDTTPTDLSKVRTTLPPVAMDTFTRPKNYDPPSVDYPPAPPALVESVEREQAFTRFCYEEFGQKVDPSLHGGVAVLVTIAGNAVQDARVANSRWSDKDPGEQVNQCLNEKARLAWKLGDATVKSGKYVVQLSFRGE